MRAKGQTELHLTLSVSGPPTSVRNILGGWLEPLRGRQLYLPKFRKLEEKYEQDGKTEACEISKWS